MLCKGINMINKFIQFVLLYSITSYSLVFANTVDSIFSPSEISLLQQRAEYNSTDIINTDNPAHKQLLQSPSRAISIHSPYLHELIKQMRQSMLAHEGIGLTAVQIGIPVRVVLLYRNINSVRQIQTLINPEIVRQTQQTLPYEERCLSLPKEPFHVINRSASITVRYLQENGQSRIETFNLGEAAVLQQELEHLEGILLTAHHDE
jgi:peptide deformylase